jgi:hypothetical protein
LRASGDEGHGKDLLLNRNSPLKPDQARLDQGPLDAHRHRV